LFLSELKDTLLYQDFFFRIEILFDDNFATKDVSGKMNTTKNSIKFVRDQPSPRFIKSHMPFELLPTAIVNSTCKVCLQSNKSNIYLYRHYIYKNEKKYKL